MSDTREIYSIQDCLDVVEDMLKDELGLGFSLVQALSEIITRGFKYTNWNRFKHANCPGCVRSPDDCDVGHDSEMWKRINAGKVQACPSRGGGTMSFSREEGFRNIDIANHKFNVVKPFEEGESLKEGLS